VPAPLPTQPEPQIKQTNNLDPFEFTDDEEMVEEIGQYRSPMKCNQAVVKASVVPSLPQTFELPTADVNDEFASDQDIMDSNPQHSDVEQSGENSIEPGEVIEAVENVENILDVDKKIKYMKKQIKVVANEIEVVRKSPVKQMETMEKIENRMKQVRTQLEEVRNSPNKTFEEVKNSPIKHFEEIRRSPVKNIEYPVERVEPPRPLIISKTNDGSTFKIKRRISYQNDVSPIRNFGSPPAKKAKKSKQTKKSTQNKPQTIPKTSSVLKTKIKVEPPEDYEGLEEEPHEPPKKKARKSTGGSRGRPSKNQIAKIQHLAPIEVPSIKVEPSEEALATVDEIDNSLSKIRIL